MKKLSIILALLLALGAVALPAAAAKKKKKKPPKPVKTTLYMHGTETLGEVENQLVTGSYMKMDATKPGDDTPKSVQITNAVGTPNTTCAGNPFFPVWIGKVVGTVKGDLKFTFWFAGSPGNVDVRVWPDVASSSCNEAYVEPGAAARILAVPGENVIVLKKANFKALASMMIQISPVNAQTEASPAIVPPVMGRALYDSTSALTSLTFSCIPARGKKC